MNKREKEILLLSKKLRIKAIEMSHKAKAAHLASSLSCIDIVAVLFHSVLNINSKRPKWKNRDRFILSKGHAATALYAALEYKGFLNEKDIKSYTSNGSLLEEHPSPNLNGVEAATGSLGHGLSIGCGISLYSKILNKSFKTYVLMSDGECNEGAVWEAALFAPAKKLSNLCAIVDFNKWQATGKSKETMSIFPLKEKFVEFGWNAIEINGHDYKQIFKAINKIYGWTWIDKIKIRRVPTSSI